MDEEYAAQMGINPKQLARAISITCRALYDYTYSEANPGDPALDIGKELEKLNCRGTRDLQDILEVRNAFRRINSQPSA